jgi:hypothetical protein
VLIAGLIEGKQHFFRKFRGLFEDLVHELARQLVVDAELAELTLRIEQLVEDELNIAPGCGVLSHVVSFGSRVWRAVERLPAHVADY